MRTVTFSKPAVQQLLNRNFVNTFTNIEGDPTAGRSIKHSPRDFPGNCTRGNGEQNVQTIFMTPKQEIFHVITGFLNGDELADEIRFAMDLYQQMNKSPDKAAQLISANHKQRLLNAGFSEQQIANRSPFGNLDMTALQGQGSGSRGSTSSQPADAFRFFSDKQILNDSKFCMNNPLITRDELESDPGALVGRGTTFFSSSSNGSQSR